MADIGNGIPITPKIRFYVASMSKQFTAMSILLLEEMGKLNLDDDVRKYIPQFPSYPRSLSIRNLLNHTGGVIDHNILRKKAKIDYRDNPSKSENLDLICSQERLEFAPGTKLSYTNSGYFLLAIIVEVASGQSFREFTNENIFSPLNMSSSEFKDDGEEIFENVACEYTGKEKQGFRKLEWKFGLVGDGGLYTTVEDLYLWDQNFYQNKLGKKSDDLIAKMIQRGVLNNGKEIMYASGLIRDHFRGVNTIIHGGELGGYRSVYIRFPYHKFSVVVLSNSAGVDYRKLYKKVSQIILEDTRMSKESA